MPENVLIVGAGAVGKVYAYHFAKAGHAVSFFAKEKYRAELERGVTLYDINRDPKKQKPIHFTDFDVVTSWEAAAQGPRKWDQIYLCISSDALSALDYHGLNAALSPTTAVVILQAGPDDYALVARHIAGRHLVKGMIVFVSYTAPFRTETVPRPGTAFFIPPLTAAPFEGPRERRDEVVATFRRSGIRATTHHDLRALTAYPTAVNMLLVTALQASGWRFEALARDEELRRLLQRAIHEAFLAVATATASTPPLWRHAVTAQLVWLFLKLSPVLLPFDMESHLEAHYKKLDTQTRLYLQTYLDYAARTGVEASALRELVGRVRPSSVDGSQRASVRTAA